MSGEADHGSRLNESGAARRDTSLPTATSPRLSRPTGFNGHASVRFGSITSDKPASQSQTRFIKLSSVSVKSVT
jgi:hypothetical protein